MSRRKPKLMTREQYAGLLAFQALLRFIHHWLWQQSMGAQHDWADYR
jgi:hypothetical protein